MSAAPRTVQRWPAGTLEEDVLAREEPLEIRVEGNPVAVTMRTPGDDLDLAAGFLFTEQVIEGPDDLHALAHLPADTAGNTVDCVLSSGVQAHREALEKATRARYATSSCGICGKESIARIHARIGPLATRPTIDPALLTRLPAALREAQETFSETGGLHAAALFTPDGRLEVLREDIGRHNAVDKVIGWRVRTDAIPIDDRILVVSSRAGFEIVQKAAVARIGVIACLGAASTLAVDLAVATNQVLAGFVRPDRLTLYTPEAR